MKNIVVIGGGIIGLSSAFYLHKAGYSVTVLDKDDFLDNCSYGNAGYVCPSHFIPLATPGIVKQGFRWMLNSRSPFYVQPRIDRSLIDWGIKFIRSATASKVEAAAIPLRDIALLSQLEYQEWSALPGFQFSLEHKGLLEIFQTEEKAVHARHTVDKARELGLDSVLLNKEELQNMEPQTRINGLGAIYFKCDSHLYPNYLMKCLISFLTQAGVQLMARQEVIQFEKHPDHHRQIRKVITGDKIFDADQVVIATGAWSREMAALLSTNLPLVPGRGYSVTLDNGNYPLIHPAVLMEGRVALTPMNGNKIRFGGTMEITSTKCPPRFKRVEGILNSVNRFFPEFNIPMPPKENIWYGYRPCSADGLPYIGRLNNFSNVLLATGHSMLGLSLGAGTGKLVAELVNEEKPSMDIKPFAVHRFE